MADPGLDHLVTVLDYFQPFISLIHIFMMIHIMPDAHPLLLTVINAVVIILALQFVVHLVGDFFFS